MDVSTCFEYIIVIIIYNKNVKCIVYAVYKIIIYDDNNDDIELSIAYKSNNTFG